MALLPDTDLDGRGDGRGEDPRGASSASPAPGRRRCHDQHRRDADQCRDAEIDVAGAPRRRRATTRRSAADATRVVVRALSRRPDRPRPTRPGAAPGRPVMPSRASSGREERLPTCAAACAEGVDLASTRRHAPAAGPSCARHGLRCPARRRASADHARPPRRSRPAGRQGRRRG